MTHMRGGGLRHAAAVGDDLYLDRLCGTIAVAWSGWQAIAALADVQVQGPMAAGGHVDGPTWQAPILAAAGNLVAPVEYGTWTVNSVASGLSSAWLAWQQSLRVPPLPWFPAFTVWPAPRAPRTPAPDTPLAVLLQDTAPLGEDRILGSIRSADPRRWRPGPNSPRRPYAEAISRAVSDRFSAWRGGSRFSRIFGDGTVPTFAPPYISSGPVMGHAWSEAGGLV